MMEDNYSKAYKEIVEILKYIPEESVNKIPKDMRDMFEAEQLKTYNFQIDTEKTFEEQELLEETKAILANIFRDYWATEIQREKIIKKQENDRLILEEQKKSLYDTENIFKKQDICGKTEAKEVTKMAVYKANFITRVFNKIKKFLKIK